jgi:DNA-binding transcriptional LysR family regulator
VFELSDHIRDLWRHDVDAAIRYGAIADGSLVVRKLADTRRVMVAAPSYLDRNGIPQDPEDLATHECVLLKTAAARADLWPLRGWRQATVAVNGRWQSNNGAITRRWALAGHGIALKSWIDVCEDIAAGRLVHVLPGLHSESYPIVLVMPASLRLAARMRALGDCLAARFDARVRAHPFPDDASRMRSASGAARPTDAGSMRRRPLGRSRR